MAFFMRRYLKHILALALVLALAGCCSRNPTKTPEESIKRYEADYQEAVALLKRQIGQGRDVDTQRFTLGMLYFGRGEYGAAIEEFTKTSHPSAKKYQALALYKSGDFTAALDVFSQEQAPDEESRYYYGLTCEKLNLFDKALSTYATVKAGPFAQRASQRSSAIEKKTEAAHIRDLDSAVAQIIARAPGQEQFPQAGALILLVDEKTEITPDNKEINTMHYVVKILNERGKEGFSETHVEYDSTYEKVFLEYARTIKPDGTVVEVGARHIRDVTKYLNFPLYSNARVSIISFPEIAEGSTIEYKVRLERNQLINKKDFCFGYPVQSSEPIIAANFTLQVAKDKEVAIKTANEQYNDFSAQLAPRVEETPDAKTYRWEFRNIPQIIPEAGMPPAVEINPVLVFTTFRSWQDIYTWWWGLAHDKMRADSAIKTKVRELTAGLETAEEKVRAIANFCAKDIRYVAVEYGQAGYEPHQAADIFKNKYGDCKDQAILAVTMLREAGFTAWPVLIGTKDSYAMDEKFPTMLFNHAIACVSLAGKTVFIDPTAETCSFGDLPSGDQERTVLVCKPDGFSIEATPLYPAEHNLVEQNTSITINDDESIVAQKTISSSGIYDQAQRYWLLYTVPDVVNEQLAAKVQEVSIGAQLAGYKIKNLNDLNKSVELSYSFSGPEYFTEGGSLRIMPQLGNLDMSLVAKEKRRYPLDFGVLDTKAGEVNFVLPAGFVIKYMPEPITQDSPWMTYTAQYRQQGRTLAFRQKFAMKKNNVSQADYPAFKAFFEQVAKKLKQRVVLERKK